MGKILKTRRKHKKTCKNISNLMKLLKNIKPRVPSPPVGTAFASIKDYRRKNNKKAVDEGLGDV